MQATIRPSRDLDAQHTLPAQCFASSSSPKPTPYFDLDHIEAEEAHHHIVLHGCQQRLLDI